MTGASTVGLQMFDITEVLGRHTHVEYPHELLWLGRWGYEERVPSNGTFKALYAGKNLINATLPYLRKGIFKDCITLVEVDLPALCFAGASCFAGATELVRVHLPVLERVCASVFLDCTALETITLESAGIIKSCGFAGCLGLKRVQMPKCSRLHELAFGFDEGIESLTLAEIDYINWSAFVGLSEAIRDRYRSTSVVRDTGLSMLALQRLSDWQRKHPEYNVSLGVL